jgi:hypothetical protein
VTLVEVHHRRAVIPSEGAADAAAILTQARMYAAHLDMIEEVPSTRRILADILPLRMCDTRARDAPGVDVAPALRASFGALLATPTLDAVGLYAPSTSCVAVETCIYQRERPLRASPRGWDVFSSAPEGGKRQLCALDWHRCKPATSCASRALYVVVHAGGAFPSVLLVVGRMKHEEPESSS